MGKRFSWFESAIRSQRNRRLQKIRNYSYCFAVSYGSGLTYGGEAIQEWLVYGNPARVRGWGIGMEFGAEVRNSARCAEQNTQSPRTGDACRRIGEDQ